MDCQRARKLSVVAAEKAEFAAEDEADCDVLDSLPAFAEGNAFPAPARLFTCTC
jgi:hypothetical protein